MEKLYPGEYYHIYNRGNNGENLFFEEKNYRYFLQKYHQYLSEYLETYAFCLMPNHFHLLVRVKDLPGSISEFIFTAACLLYSQQSGASWICKKSL